ncbi:MAG: DNA primase [Pirellulales bacterium]
MNPGAAFDAKEQVRQATDIVDLVGSYIQLRRQGRNFVGLCPWHDDSRPSLQVNPDRQSFKCWVCDYGGDVFGFIMRAENLEFREALEHLAERAGIQLKALGHSSEPGGPPPRPEDDKRTLYRVCAWAEQVFHHCLLTSAEAEPGRAYLAERGISEEIIRQFHLGFAPNRWDWLLERARASNVPISVMERVGLLRRRELAVRGEMGAAATGAGHYDWFRGRVMFSIRDARSRPIAFGGRVLPQLADDRSAKYINSPETPLFSKSRELYGLDYAREHFKLPGGAIIMEGYTDCLMAYQHGIPNCVAVLGTALGERHLQLLRRYTDSITLVLDGDAAGRRRTNEILDNLLALFEKISVDMRILTLPEGIDPCDFIATHGCDPFLAMIATATDALEHKFNAVTNGLDTLTDTHRASQAAEQLLTTLAQIRPSGGDASSQALLREEQMLSRIAREFHLSDAILRERLKAIRTAARNRPASRSAAREDDANSLGGRPAISVRIGDLATWDRDLLELIILDHTFILRLADVVPPTALSSPAAQRIFTTCIRMAEQGTAHDFGRLMAAFDEPEMKNLLVALDESAAMKTAADRDRWFAGLIETYHRQLEGQEKRTRLVAAREQDNDAEQLLTQFLQKSRQKHLSDYERKKK